MASRSVSFSIPASELPRLKVLADASPDHLKALQDALAVEKPTVDVDALCGLIAERTGIEIGALRPIIRALWRLAIVQRGLGLSADQFVEALSAQLREVVPGKWDAGDSEGWAARQRQIASLLASEGALTAGAKAADLLLEQQLNFCRARVVTDMRPVLDERAERVQGFLPIHTLGITYHELGETRSVHIAMKYSQLAELRNQLERAERKEKLLRETLAGAGFSVIDMGAESDV